jgi:hypothetical protein
MGAPILLLVPAIVALASIPLIMRVVPRNGLYGFRTRRTLADDATWFAANHFAGWALFFAALVSAVLLMVIPPDVVARPAYRTLLLVGPILLAVVASFLYLRAILAKSSR